MIVLGLNGKTYRNTANFAAPVWDELENITNVTLNASKSQADVTTRGGNGWRQQIGTLKEGTIDSELIYDTEDPDFLAFQTAFFANQTVELAVMDGDIAVSKSQGLRATFDIIDFSRDEQLEDAMKTPIQFSVSYGTTPEWYIVT